MFNETRQSFRNISGIINKGSGKLIDSINQNNENTDRDTLLWLTRVFAIASAIICVFYLVNFFIKINVL